MELTQEYFDRQLNNLATKEDLKPLATTARVDKAIEQLASIINDTIAVPMEQHFAEVKDNIDVRTEVEALKCKNLNLTLFDLTDSSFQSRLI